MDLRRLILVLTLCSALIPFANTFYAGYAAQRQQLIDNTLEANYAYATKLAKSTDDFLQSALQQLAYTAQLLSTHMDSPEQLSSEATRLRLQTKSFNSITIHDASGLVLATSPEALKLKGRTLYSDVVRESIATQKPAISEPYMASTGNFIVLLTHPVFSPQGQYLGAVAGSVYLKQENILDRLLGTHFYKDGSYLYVVDKSKRIIYHPNSDRIGMVVDGNPAIDQVVRGDSGKVASTNSQGTAMLAGFSVVQSTGWGIISQRPKASTLAPLDRLVRHMWQQTLPMAVVMLLVIWWSAHRIASPLRQLANGARTMDRPETAQNIQSVSSWYYEAQELKKALLVGIGLLHQNISKLRQDVHTDPLTGLGNRRHLDAALANLEANQTPFSVVAVDIDHFKHVNDSFGHGVGDTVLKQLAVQMREVSRAHDLPCRVGGEEFVLLLPNASCHIAAQVAERLRRLVEATELPTVGRITISLGVAGWPENSSSIPSVFTYADEMLYAAKRNGRNRVEIYEAKEAQALPAE